MFKFTLCLLLSLPFFQTTAEETPIPDHFEPVSWLKEFLAAHEAVYRTGSLDPIRKFLHPGYEDVYLEPRFANFLYQKRQYESVVVNNVAHKFLMAKILDWEYPKPNVLVMLGRWDSSLDLEFHQADTLKSSIKSGADNHVVFAIEIAQEGYRAVCSSSLIQPFDVAPDWAREIWDGAVRLCMEDDFGREKRKGNLLEILGFPQQKSSLREDTLDSEEFNTFGVRELNHFNVHRI